MGKNKKGPKGKKDAGQQGKPQAANNNQSSSKLQLKEVKELPKEDVQEEVDSDEDSNYDPNDYAENNNVFLPDQGDTDAEDDELEWCEHMDDSEGVALRQLIRKSSKCCQCEKKSHFSCIHKDCMERTDVSCCKNVGHIFPHLVDNDHPVIVHHKLKVVLCTRCNIRASIRQFIRHCGVPTDHILDEELGPEPMDELQALVGFVNFGNTCYMNAVFQLLGHCGPFTDYFLSFEPPNGWEGFPIATSRSTTAHFAFNMRLIWGVIKVPFITPWKIIHCIRQELPSFESFQQQDATEFLRSLLDILDRELKMFGNFQQFGQFEQFPDESNGDNIDPDNNRPRPTIITEMFQGRLENQIQCHSCGFRSRTYESFFDLSVPIVAEDEMFFEKPKKKESKVASLRKILPKQIDGLDPGLLVHQHNGNRTSLSACLDRFFQNNTLHGDNQYSCSKCKTLVDATKSTKATHLPEVIIIQLKRFRHTMRGTRKVDKTVEFPVRSMNFGRWTKSKKSAYYDLAGIIVHEGHSVEYGHYVAYCRHEQDAMWYKFDDLNVSRHDATRVAKEAPYILMYRKRRHGKINRTGTRKPTESPYNFFEASKRYLERCPDAWEVIKETLENDVANNVADIKRFKEDNEFEDKLTAENCIPDAMTPANVVSSSSMEDVYKVFLRMMIDIREAIAEKANRKNENPASEDNTQVALNKLVASMDGWFRLMMKKQWVHRQVLRLEHTSNDRRAARDREEAERHNRQ
ncbi:unnamed protein product [Caenorhabditis sp. 36 PRJEB53466]|nr:unnamed protein product [Caenorhabditis sp. 36 PRJEB53466]